MDINGIDKEKNRVHIQIKGNKKAIERMRRVVEEIEESGVEVQLTTEVSK